MWKWSVLFISLECFNLWIVWYLNSVILQFLVRTEHFSPDPLPGWFFNEGSSNHHENTWCLVHRPAHREKSCRAIYLTHIVGSTCSLMHWSWLFFGCDELGAASNFNASTWAVSVTGILPCNWTTLHAVQTALSTTNLIGWQQCFATHGEEHIYLLCLLLA